MKILQFRRAFMLGIAAATAACAAPIIRTPSEEVSKYPLIDMHAHYPGRPPRTAQEFIKTMDTVGIRQTVLFLGGTGTREVGELQKYPGGLCSFMRAPLVRTPFAQGLRAAMMDLLQTHPNLYFELAIKNKRLRSDGYPILFGMTLREDWRQLFESYPERFLLGFDFPGTGPRHGTPLEAAQESTEFFQAILMQLTPDTARKIAYENAQAMLARGKMKR